MVNDNSNTAIAQTSATELSAEVMEQVVVGGDLSKLTPRQRLQYYNARCAIMDLDPLSRPFQYIYLNNKLVLYADRNCADQLRAKRKINVVKIEREQIGDLYVVTAYGVDATGRQDSEIGAVSVAGKKGDDLANAMMKASTKAKRRLTLSMCGLGMVDESELETIRDARPVRVNEVTGELIDDGEWEPPSQEPPAPPKPPAKATDITREFESDTAERDLVKLKAQIQAEHERQGLTGGKWANYILEHMGKPGKALNVEELKRLLLNLECDAIKAKLKVSDAEWVAVVDSAIGVDVRPPAEEQTVEQWSKIKSCLIDLAAERGVRV